MSVNPWDREASADRRQAVQELLAQARVQLPLFPGPIERSVYLVAAGEAILADAVRQLFAAAPNASLRHVEGQVLLDVNANVRRLVRLADRDQGGQRP
jgi:hypothetical protein